MKIKNKIEIKINLKKPFTNLVAFFRKYFIRISVITAISLVSILITSFGIESSSQAKIDAAAFTSANIAKDNTYNKVHFESTLNREETSGKQIFSEANSTANSSFLHYSSTAFLQRNNFYNVPINANPEIKEKSIFSFNFLSSDISLSNISPSTDRIIYKKYTTEKYVDNVLIDNYSATKARMETMDLYLLSNTDTKKDGYSIILPDYVAEKIVNENENIESLRDCIGLSGIMSFSGLSFDVYIRNVVVTSPKIGDKYDINDCDFTSGNVRYGQYLKLCFGSYFIMNFSTMYSYSGCLSCADFDSEYFKINSYFTNELKGLYSKTTTTKIYEYRCEQDSVELVVNNTISTNLTSVMQKSANSNSISYFDGNIFLTVTGIIVFAISIVVAIVLFATKRYFPDKMTKNFILLSLFPILIIGIFSLLFLFVFASKQEFVAFYFSSLSVVVLIASLIECSAFLISYLIRGGKK